MHLLLVAFVFLALFVPVDGAADTTVVEVAAPSLQGARFRNPEHLPLLVHTPPGYENSDRRYPVVYYLPGFTTDVQEYVDGAYDGMHAGEVLDLHFRSGGTPFLLVVVHGRNDLGGSFYVNSPVTGNWENWVSEDAVDYVDSHYRTHATTAARGVAGDSMGGFGALNLAMRHPDRFGSVYAISPALFDEQGLETQGMFTHPGYVRAHFIQAERMRDWPVAQHEERFLAFMDELYRAGTFAYRRAFVYAYAAAFAWDREATIPPWIAYPFDEEGAEADERVLARYRSGFGDLTGKVSRYGRELRSLEGLFLHAGRNDPLEWIPRGCRRFAALLEAEGIDHEVLFDDRGYVDDMEGRWREGMFPFFQQVFEASAR